MTFLCGGCPTQKTTNSLLSGPSYFPISSSFTSLPFTHPSFLLYSFPLHSTPLTSQVQETTSHREKSTTTRTHRNKKKSNQTTQDKDATSPCRTNTNLYLPRRGRALAGARHLRRQALGRGHPAPRQVYCCHLWRLAPQAACCCLEV